MSKVGNMRHYLTVQEKTQEPDGAGGFIETWRDINIAPHVWVEIKPIRDSVIDDFGTRHARFSYQIDLRYRDDIVQGMRLLDLDHNRAFIIETAYDATERRAVLRLRTREERI